jgi:preprotein translocase subunit SecY
MKCVVDPGLEKALTILIILIVLMLVSFIIALVLFCYEWYLKIRRDYERHTSGRKENDIKRLLP